MHALLNVAYTYLPGAMMSVRETIDPKSSMWGWLAFDLWFWRTQRELSLAQVGLIAKVTRGSVCNWEAGRARPTEEHMQRLDAAWCTGGHFERLLHYAKTGHDPDWFKQYLQYEAAAKVIKLYHGKIVPTLLQTEDYIRGVLAGRKATAIEDSINSRNERQKLLTAPHRPHLWVLLDQEVLECPVGSPKVMIEQLDYLLEVSADPLTSVRIVPRSAGFHPGHDGPFQILKLGSGRLGTREVAYVGAQLGGRLIEGGEETEVLGIRCDQIGDLAMSKADSRSLILETKRGYQ
ncbi:XRE family transcriptional regulator [Actinomadura logoneensis]|uniref:XRE family transcriptional regulator n=1 Tax=Actinomadura logoneensis TaxID=2293572 RepID=A0A372JMZ8_9ACTN|nr:helix-turn-helix transcriptional regulator [Actinomadura logoneensis]RFU41385.1 XRE family transcriptional regulator [Actinomadura logoneensis]